MNNYFSQFDINMDWVSAWRPTPELKRPMQDSVDEINKTLSGRDDVEEFMAAWNEHKHIITDWMLNSPQIRFVFREMIKEGLTYDQISKKVYAPKDKKNWYVFLNLELMRVQMIEQLCRAPIETLIYILKNKLFVERSDTCSDREIYIFHHSFGGNYVDISMSGMSGSLDKYVTKRPSELGGESEKVKVIKDNWNKDWGHQYTRDLREVLRAAVDNSLADIKEIFKVWKGYATDVMFTYFMKLDSNYDDWMRCSLKPTWKKMGALHYDRNYSVSTQTEIYCFLLQLTPDQARKVLSTVKALKAEHTSIFVSKTERRDRDYKILYGFRYVALMKAILDKPLEEVVQKFSGEPYVSNGEPLRPCTKEEHEKYEYVARWSCP